MTNIDRKPLVEDLKAVREAIIEAKALLDRRDPDQLRAWGELDHAQVRLESAAPLLL